MVKVSVILSTYDRANTLSRAIDSVLAQTLKDIELIIVDDGSKDATPDLLSDYAKKDKRIKVITQSNQGLPAARNTGVTVSSGKYIAFIDSDDVYAVNHLSFHFNFLEKHREYSACILSAVVPIKYYYPGVSFAGSDKYSVCHGSPFTDGRIFSSLGPHSFIKRNSFMSMAGYRKEKTIIEDLDFTLRYSEKLKWAKISDRGSYFYTLPEDNSKTSLTNSDIETFVKRHIACYVSSWCRIHNLKDPIPDGKSLEEIIFIAKSMPIKDRAIIYSSIRYFSEILCSTKGINTREAKYYLLGILSDYRIMQKVIDIKFKHLQRNMRH